MGEGSIRILGRLYRFKRKAMPDAAGLCDYAKATITIAPGMDRLETKDTVLHEVMHAILYQQGRPSGGEVEEVYVRALATGLVAVIEDNPQFASYLAQVIVTKEKV